MPSSANNTGSGSTDAGASLAARRARLRGSLARASYNADPFAESPPVVDQTEGIVYQPPPDSLPGPQADESGADASGQAPPVDPDDFFANAPGPVNVYGVPLNATPLSDEVVTPDEAPVPPPSPRRRRGLSVSMQTAESNPSAPAPYDLSQFGGPPPYAAETYGATFDQAPDISEIDPPGGGGTPSDTAGHEDAKAFQHYVDSAAPEVQSFSVDVAEPELAAEVSSPETSENSAPKACQAVEALEGEASQGEPSQGEASHAEASEGEAFSAVATEHLIQIDTSANQGEHYELSPPNQEESVERPADVPHFELHSRPPAEPLAPEGRGVLTEQDRRLLQNIEQTMAVMPQLQSAIERLPAEHTVQLIQQIEKNVEFIPCLADRTTLAAETLQNMDQSLSSCAVNLAALQNLATEQNEVLSSLTQGLQIHTLAEIGLNLSSLTESLTAALEPMKAIGELIPALDQLITTLDSREGEKPQRLSPDDLVTSLSDQLSAGLIDPWTFKCAYMAVYPSDTPAELLHRLVELLGTQRLSGDLFRAAYEAVQSAEAPPRLAGYSSASSGDFTRGISDEAIKVQIEELQRSNEEMRRRQEERERELTELLSQKERELQNAQELLNQKLEELNSRYEDAAEILNSREEDYRAALESKDMELIEKESELNMLRSQMEELRSQMEDMVKDLQNKLKEEMQQIRDEREKEKEDRSDTAVPNPNGQNFFDPAPGRGPTGGFFEPALQQKGFFPSDPAPSTFGDGFGEGYLNPQLQGQAQPQLQQPMQAQPVQQYPVAADQNAYQQPLQAMQPQQAPAQPMAAQYGAGYAAPQTASQPAGYGYAQPAPTQPLPVQVPPQQAPAPINVPKPAVPAAPATTPFSGGQSGSYGSGVRAQVFEVIVRQALAGAPWREICAGPMQVNNISPEEVEAEVRKRQGVK